MVLVDFNSFGLFTSPLTLSHLFDAGSLVFVCRQIFPCPQILVSHLGLYVLVELSFAFEHVSILLIKRALLSPIQAIVKVVIIGVHV